jgi:ribulose-bisphosphate carboxylase large chain
MARERVLATYLIETSFPLQEAVEAMAGEQSSGTFVKVPGEDAELLARSAARVEEIIELESADSPSLPGARLQRGQSASGRYRRARVTLSFPFENIGPSLTTLLTTVSGNLYELRHFSGLRLLDVQIPETFAQVYLGPQFGVEGTRALSGVSDRPLIGTIIKPSVGLSVEATADLVKALCEAGIDFIKDDELQTNAPSSPLAARVDAVMRVINGYADRTGKKVMYAFNITADLDAMLRHHDLVLAANGTCIMVNLISVGLAAVAHLCKHSQLPIHGHRAGWGALSRHPLLGMDYSAFQKFYRLAGVDHLHVNGLRNKFCEPDESVIASARACLKPMFGGYVAMPVFSSGQWALQAPMTYQALGSVDLIYLAGGGILAHPSGAAAGVDSLREGWAAALEGVALEDYARTHPALREALEKFGSL